MCALFNIRCRSPEDQPGAEGMMGKEQNHQTKTGGLGGEPAAPFISLSHIYASYRDHRNQFPDSRQMMVVVLGHKVQMVN
jgi:hypothetical protein